MNFFSLTLTHAAKTRRVFTRYGRRTTVCVKNAPPSVDARRRAYRFSVRAHGLGCTDRARSFNPSHAPVTHAVPRVFVFAFEATCRVTSDISRIARAFLDRNDADGAKRTRDSSISISVAKSDCFRRVVPSDGISTVHKPRFQGFLPFAYRHIRRVNRVRYFHRNDIVEIVTKIRSRCNATEVTYSDNSRSRAVAEINTEVVLGEEDGGE